ncbi:LADA_0D01200g1_1 [Lachancea dasiensis]|uniref:Pantoate--beta-alanine ligase n=1 Tax=Lachancea dasiensis TaxID=1072105 RepID=A0A1G4J416_9SACH|nr:LADA_0D01200g1_1 [Lachancea dasiensis]
MLVLHTVQDVISWRNENIDRRTQTSGFVPTMGCLHDGHLSLIRKSRLENNFTIVSIFVNPSQFAPSEDLDKYPRTLQADLALLEKAGVDLCFVPNAAEMYPQGIPLEVEAQKGPFVTVIGVSEQLEGRTRPNFFRGVATIVTKLLNVVLSTHAYFGQKDFQQFTVLKVMAEELFMNTKLKMMPIVRDADGLALSSRNRYLCQESRHLSTAVYQALQMAAACLQNLDTNEEVQRSDLVDKILQHWVPHVTSGDFEVDYVSVADPRTLMELESVSGSTAVVISCAVFVKDRENSSTVVRLIDNILLNQ